MLPEAECLVNTHHIQNFAALLLFCLFLFIFLISSFSNSFLFHLFASFLIKFVFLLFSVLETSGKVSFKLKSHFLLNALYLYFFFFYIRCTHDNSFINNSNINNLNLSTNIINSH